MARQLRRLGVWCLRRLPRKRAVFGTAPLARPFGIMAAGAYWALPWFRLMDLRWFASRLPLLFNTFALPTLITPDGFTHVVPSRYFQASN